VKFEEMCIPFHNVINHLIFSTEEMTSPTDTTGRNTVMMLQVRMIKDNMLLQSVTNVLCDNDITLLI